MNHSHPSYYLVIGLGKSGLSMANFLHSQGMDVVATDIDPSKKEAADRLSHLGVETQIGFHDQNTFDRAACLVPSPGIPLTLPYIRDAVEKGVPVKSELDIFYQHNRLPVIAITGTNGKTTTTSLMGEMLKGCGYHPFVCGNIGTPLVELFMTTTPFDIVVAEVSSFQIDISNRFRPDVGVLLNISEDHLDRYIDYSAYEDAKWRLFQYQTDTDTAVINFDMENSIHRSSQLAATVMAFTSGSADSPKIHARIRPDEIELTTRAGLTRIDTRPLTALPGRHNRENIAAALLAGLAVNADLNGLQTGLKRFRPLSHRIERVTEINGISFFNDSKGTNADAVNRALQSFNDPVILILGGRGKGTDFSALKEEVVSGVKAVIAIGETKRQIIDTFDSICPVKPADTMKQAVQTAFDSADTGDVVLLSPACSSFDMYDNYICRGEDFTRLVLEMKKV